jgi:hypothetical protein
VSEMELRSAAPGVPITERLSELLARYLSINHIEVNWFDCSMRLDGNLVIPSAMAGEPTAERRAMLESLEAVIGVITETGAQWKCHPHLFIAGDVQRQAGGGQEFCGLEGRVTIELLLPPDPR